MSAEQYSDDEIVKGCKSGDSKMQEVLYNLYASRMIAVCSRYTNDRMEAEDIFHDTFIKVYKKIESFRGGSLKSWMYRVFINSSIDFCKSQYKSVHNVSCDDYELADSGYMKILSELTVNELMSIINGLPSGYKMVFNMYAIDGYSHKEIGEKLNISVGTSKSQLFNAKAMLVDLLDDNNISRYAM